MAHLFDTVTLRKLDLPNRVMVSPMCQYSAREGNATAWHMAHLGSLALGGAGLLCLEATAVTPEGRITPGCLGLWNDDNEQALAHVVRTLRGASPTKLAIQLSHAGRKASSAPPWEGGQLIDTKHGGWMPLGPSAVPQKPGEPAPRALSIADLGEVKQAFVEAANRAVRLGFDAIELHGAHGYLLHQFLSPVANQRVDQYGGSLDNRMRFPLEVFEAVRAAVPDHVPVGVRVSATDWIDDEPSWNLEQTIAFGLALKSRGVDWLDVSTGGVSPRQKIPVGPGYQVSFAEAVKREVGTPVIAVGMITEAKQAQTIISSGQADLVALGRGFLYDPRWVWHAAAELGAHIQGPAQYWRSLPSGTHRVFGDTTFGQR
ncbi:MAG TPA: NADH:flavin oxidoreductase/NADH oxidase [Burkholderiaceae bacterium]|nr:NADH:flavin oxidoreductase/NADH oxidase [Burkholderiaceae bacterium]